MAGTIGANFDVAAIVAELMKGESRQLNRMNLDEAKQEVKLSLYGQFKSVLETFKQSVTKIKDAFETIAYTGSSSNEDIVKANIDSNGSVYPGTHSLVVSKLAKAESRAAVTTFSSKSSALSLSGNLNFTVNSIDYSVAVTAGDSLENIRDRINASSNNNGITANIMSTTNGLGDDEYTLIVSSNKTGVDNAVSISGSLAATFNFSNELSAAQNAEFTFNGKNVVRDSNYVDDVLDGISFTLLSTGSASITIAESSTDRNAAVKKSIQDMVSSYNAILNFVDQNIDSKSMPDSTIPLLKTRLKNLMSETFTGSGDLTTLFDIGVRIAKSVQTSTSSGKEVYSSFGRLEVDTDKLDKVLSDNSTDLKNFLLSDDNFVSMADDELDSMVKFTGPISQQTIDIKEYITRLNSQIGREEVRLDQVKAQLTQKYAALSAMMDKFDQLSGYLDMTFSNMNGKK